MTDPDGMPPGGEGREVAANPPAATSRAEWLAWRRNGIGGSDIAAILGHSSWASPWSLWAEKTGLYTPPDHMTERQQIGLDLEAAIAGMFHRKTGLYVTGEQTWIERPRDDEWARCTVDGVVSEGPNAPSIAELLGGFEAKTDGRFSWPDGIPIAYQCQGQWNMWVTGLPRWWFAVLHAGFRFEVYELEADHEDMCHIVAAARSFWHDHVLTGVPPETDGHDATLAAIAEAWPTEQTGKSVELDTTAVEAFEAWQRARGYRLHWERSEKALKAELQAAVADAETACLDGVPVLSYRSQTRQPFTVAASTFRVLREIKPKPNKE